MISFSLLFTSYLFNIAKYVLLHTDYLKSKLNNIAKVI